LGVGSTDTVEIELLDAEERLGERVFHDASDPRMTSNRYLSCASCHQDGDADNQTWDFSQRGEGLRSTTPLAGRSGSGQNLLHWSANFDELQDFENDIRDHFGGRGFMNESAFAQSRLPLGAPKAGRSAELDALAAYVRGLSEPRRSPFRGDDGNLTPGAARGQAVFESQGCASCHSGPTTTDGQRHDVGTVDSSSGRVGGLFSTSIDTPSLGGLWATAPYFHNGSAGTLDAVLERGHGSVGPLSPTQRADLVEYLRSLEAG
jgi:cytochrome c peroxidase